MTQLGFDSLPSHSNSLWKLVIIATSLCVKHMVSILYTDLKFYIDKYIVANWQDEWNNMGANKLCSVKPALGDWS